MKNLPLTRIMTRPLVTVAPDATLDVATSLMEQRKVHHLVVVEGDRMVGILSSADLLKVVLVVPSNAGHEPAATGLSLHFRVRDVMESRVAVLRENASTKEAALALSLGGFHALPVLALDGTPVGIVTSSDLMGLLVDQIERDASGSVASDAAVADSQEHMVPRLLEVLRAAEIYLRSGHCDQQHARLTRAVERARESATSGLGFQPLHSAA
jgi:CBS domain-containing protein